MGSESRRLLLWRSLRTRLLVGHLLVIVVALATVLLAMQLSAPTFFGWRMMGLESAGDMADAMQRMMGPPSGSPGGMMRLVDGIVTDAFRRSLVEALAVAGLAAVVVAVAMSLFVSARVDTPIRRLIGASRRIAAGRYAERVATDEVNEFQELAASFNEMASALEATEQRRLELVGDVAHELRTPIATLKGYLEGLQDGVVEPSTRTWARLHDEAERLHRLVDDLQELSRAEARQIPLVLRPVDPLEIARTAADRLVAEFAAKGLTFRSDLPVGLPRVEADCDRAIQVVTNLLGNALRYTPVPGTVHLVLRPTGDAVEFTVSDTGIGIAADHLPHLFERFYRVDKSRSRALGGSGIGLTIAHALVEAMGGQMRARSDGPGRGATFGFTLPIAR